MIFKVSERRFIFGYISMYVPNNNNTWLYNTF